MGGHTCWEGPSGSGAADLVGQPHVAGEVGLPSAVLRVMSELTGTELGILSFLIMSKPPHMTVQPVYAIPSSTHCD